MFGDFAADDSGRSCLKIAAASSADMFCRKNNSCLGLI
jgi:hypothetical protein